MGASLELLSHDTLLVSDRLLAHGACLDVGKRVVARSTTSNILDFLEGNGGNEALGLPGLGDLSVELVDLFQGESLGLVDHCVYEDGAKTTIQLAWLLRKTGLVYRRPCCGCNIVSGQHDLPAETSPNPEDVGVNSVDHVRGRVGNSLNILV